MSAGIRNALIVSLAVACSGNRTPATATPTPIENKSAADLQPSSTAPHREDERTSSAMHRYADDICACTSAECALQTYESFQWWAVRERLGRDEELDVEQRPSEAPPRHEIKLRMASCIKRLESASGSGAKATP
jgi:hypothetical protein